MVVGLKVKKMNFQGICSLMLLMIPSLENIIRNWYFQRQYTPPKSSPNIAAIRIPDVKYKNWKSNLKYVILILR